MVGLLPLLCGCYLGHVAGGQWRLLRARQPIERLLEEPDTPQELRASLARVQEVRSFAAELGLNVGERYASYAEWPGDRIVTTVVASEPGRVEAAGFWFPVVGRVPYKGFFDPERAEAEAARLRARGLDVCVSGVPAYSTLGWFDDPVTTPMLRRGEPYLVETLLHELVHSTVYAPDEADWNEGLASFVGAEASVAFFARLGRGEEQRLWVDERRRVRAELLALRQRVEALYAAEPAGEARAARRRELEAETRARLRALPLHSLDAPSVAEAARLGDACLALLGTYASLVPQLAQAYEAGGSDLPTFILRAEEAARDGRPRSILPAD